MEIITLGDNEEKAIENMSRVIRAGGLVVAPTDTVYGIIGDGTNKNVIARLYDLKKRPKEKPFLVFVRDVAMARQFAYISDAKARFLETVWPGSVTVRFHHKEKLPDILTSCLDTIGMRVPNHAFLLKLLSYLNIPLVQSSANIFRQPCLTNVQEIIASFDEQKIKPDLVVDGGEIAGQASVIVDFITNEPRILRSGMMSKDELDSLLGRLTQGV